LAQRGKPREHRIDGELEADRERARHLHGDERRDQQIARGPHADVGRLGGLRGGDGHHPAPSRLRPKFLALTQMRRSRRRCSLFQRLRAMLKKRLCFMRWESRTESKMPVTLPCSTIDSGSQYSRTPTAWSTTRIRWSAGRSITLASHQ